MERQYVDPMSCLHEDTHWQNLGKFRIHRCDQCGRVLKKKKKRQHIDDGLCLQCEMRPATSPSNNPILCDECGIKSREEQLERYMKLLTLEDVEVIRRAAADAEAPAPAPMDEAAPMPMCDTCVDVPAAETWEGVPLCAECAAQCKHEMQVRKNRSAGAKKAAATRRAKAQAEWMALQKSLQQ